MSLSKHYSDRQLATVDLIGDKLLPGLQDLPPFSASKAVRHIDRVLDYMPEGDRKDLGLLLTLLSYTPRFFVGFFIELLESLAKLPGALGAGFRFVRLGLRGLVMTLYYCDEAVQKAIGYDVKVYTGDFKPYVLPKTSAMPEPTHPGGPTL